MFTSEEIMCGKGGEASKFVFGRELRGSRSERRNGSFGTKLENEERRQKERRLDMHSHFHLVEFIFGLFFSKHCVEYNDNDWEGSKQEDTKLTW